MQLSKSISVALIAISTGANADSQEGQVIDFKSDSADPRKMGGILAKAAACFANGDGGSIVLGVLNKISGTAAFEGTGYVADWCRQRIYELVTPSLITEAEAFTFSGKTLVHIQVFRGIDVHEFDGRYFRRLGKSCE